MQLKGYNWLKRHHNVSLVVGLIILILAASFEASNWEIPKTWDVSAIKKALQPPPDSTMELHYAPEAYSKAFPEYVIYKTYTVYAQGYEPPAYWIP